MMFANKKTHVTSVIPNKREFGPVLLRLPKRRGIRLRQFIARNNNNGDKRVFSRCSTIEKSQSRKCEQRIDVLSRIDVRTSTNWVWVLKSWHLKAPNVNHPFMVKTYYRLNTEKISKAFK